MKELLFALLLCGSLSAYPQTKKEGPMVNQIQPSSITGTSKAVIVENVPLVHTSQFLPINKNGKLIVKGNIQKQINQLFKNITSALKESHSGIDNLVKMNIYISRDGLIPEIQNQLSRKFEGKTKPAITFVTGDLVNPDADIAMDVIATSDINIESKNVNYYHSPKVYGNSFAHVAVLPAGGVTYVSGQADKGELREATQGTIKQLEATLQHLGIAKNQVIQIKSFMHPMSDVSIVEKEFARFFEGQTVPPLVFVNWISENPVIEIELIAAAPSSAKTTELMSFITPPGMTTSPIYSKVSQINHGKKIYLSGIYGSSANNASQQTSEIFKSLKEILSDAGSDFAHLAKATYYVSDNKASVALNDIRPKFYDPKRPPAASKAMVKGVGIKDMSITIDMIGVVKE